MRKPMLEEIILVKATEAMGKLPDEDFPLSKGKFEEWFASLMTMIKKSWEINVAPLLP